MGSRRKNVTGRGPAGKTAEAGIHEPEDLPAKAGSTAPRAFGGKRRLEMAKMGHFCKKCRNGPFFVGEVRPLDRTALRGRRRAELVPPPRPVRFPVHPER